ncbi:MAG: hypothetical protein V9G98_10630 [Candidatus Competibacter sp.]
MVWLAKLFEAILIRALGPFDERLFRRARLSSQQLLGFFVIVVCAVCVVFQHQITPIDNLRLQITRQRCNFMIAILGGGFDQVGKGFSHADAKFNQLFFCFTLLLL